MTASRGPPPLTPPHTGEGGLRGRPRQPMNTRSRGTRQCPKSSRTAPSSPPTAPGRPTCWSSTAGSSRIGPGPARRPRVRRHRLLRDARRHRSAHPSRNALHGHLFGRRFRERHPRRAVGRHHHGGRLLPAVARPVAARSAADVAQQDRQGLRRLLLPHGDHLVGRAGVQRDGRRRRQGHHLVQALHGLQGRADGQRRRDVLVVPALRRARRAAARPCRERRRGGAAAAEADGRGQ